MWHYDQDKKNVTEICHFYVENDFEITKRKKKKRSLEICAAWERRVVIKVFAVHRSLPISRQLHLGRNERGRIERPEALPEMSDHQRIIFAMLLRTQLEDHFEWRRLGKYLNARWTRNREGTERRKRAKEIEAECNNASGTASSEKWFAVKKAAGKLNGRDEWKPAVNNGEKIVEVVWKKPDHSNESVEEKLSKYREESKVIALWSLKGRVI